MQCCCHRRPPSPEQEEPSEERDKRTVMCMQLGARVGKHELEEFFAGMGKKVSLILACGLYISGLQVKSVRMIADKNSRRSKGIAYVEFFDFQSANEVSCCYSNNVDHVILCRLLEYLALNCLVSPL